MRMLRASMTLGVISAVGLLATLPDRKLTKEFLESEIKEKHFTRIGDRITHCRIVTHSGFEFTGESAVVDAKNFDEKLGEQYAYEQALNGMWLPYSFWLHKAMPEFSNLNVCNAQCECDNDESLSGMVKDWQIPNDTTFDFGTAVEALKQGARVARAGWNGKGMFLSLVKGRDTDYHVNSEVFGTGNDGNSQNQLPLLDAIYMKTADNKLVPWLASQTDVLAEDWQIVE